MVAYCSNLVASWMPSFCFTCDKCDSTVLVLSQSSAAIRLARNSRPSDRKTSSSRSLSLNNRDDLFAVFRAVAHYGFSGPARPPTKAPPAKIQRIAFSNLLAASCFPM